MDLKTFIRDIPDYPKPGIIFKDITPLFQDSKALKYMLDALAEPWKDQNINVVLWSFLTWAALNKKCN